MSKELHISRKHYPHTVRDEHYCRRWVALTILDDLAEITSQKQYTGPLCKAQKSTYLDTQDEYLVVSLAHPTVTTPNLNVSLSMGIYLDEHAKKTLNFLNDTAIPKREVNQTCERCALFDCRERIAAPTILQKNTKMKNYAKRCVK